MTDLPKNIKNAVAVGYNQDDKAPKILAKGKGLKAERILELASKYNVLIKKDKDLLSVLNALNIDDYIPEMLYSAFAVILAKLYESNQGLIRKREEGNEKG